MKRRVSILLLSFMIIFSAFSQDSNGENKFNQIMSHFYFPTEFGITCPTNQNMNFGITGKTSVEWRLKPMKSVFCIFEYNGTSFDYSDLQPQNSNLLSGTVNYSDILLGAGYRFNFASSWCIAFSVMGGMSDCTYGKIVQAGTNYKTENISTWVPAVKANLMLEYYFNPVFGIYLGGAYKQYLKNTIYSSDLKKEGNAEISIGMTTTLF